MFSTGGEERGGGPDEITTALYVFLWDKGLKILQKKKQTF